MFRNYFKTAWRTLWRNKFYTSLNIFGLAIGLAAGILILLWIEDEFSFDSFHHQSADIYRVVSNLQTGNGLQSWYNSSPATAVSAQKNIPGIREAVRISDHDYAVYSGGGKEFNGLHSACVDSSFFKVFDFPLQTGNNTRPFPDDQSVIISASLATKFFGTQDPIGKTILADHATRFTVNGVIKDFPANSSIRYDLLFPMSLVAKDYTEKSYWKNMDLDWGNYYCDTYLLLQPGTQPKKIEAKLTGLLHRYSPEDSKSFLSLRALKDMHLYQADGSSPAMQMVKIFLAAALFILCIACINYVNLSTARSMLRAKEVSLRKIIGAARAQLFIQFLSESALVFSLAALLAIAGIAGLIPLYNTLTGKSLVFNLLDHRIWLTLSVTLAAALAASAIYPALLLSSFRPLLALKGRLSFGMGNNSFRKILVVTQFSFSVALIIGTLVINRQLSFIRNKELGYDRSYVFSFRTGNLRAHYQTIRAELLQQPAISGISSVDGNIINAGSSTGDTWFEGKAPGTSFVITQFGVDKEFFPLMKLQMTSGHPFTGEASDSVHYILNETAVRATGIKDPIGKPFALHDVKGTIVGIAKDFHFRSLKEKIEPAIFYYEPAGSTMYIRTSRGGAAAAVAAAGAAWKKYNAGFPFQYKFLDEKFDALYKSDQQAGLLFNIFASIAILVSCLGLLGLAAYTAQVKTKEIGIRKVLGAGVAGLAIDLTRHFIGLVGIAILIASPLSWWAMHKWLQDFVYQAPMGWEIFAGAAGLSIFIAIVTVSSQAIRAALANPVKTLRSE